jgi:hypothetical protein
LLGGIADRLTRLVGGHDACELLALYHLFCEQHGGQAIEQRAFVPEELHHVLQALFKGLFRFKV